jgi:hypothetical protein
VSVRDGGNVSDSIVGTEIRRAILADLKHDDEMKGSNSASEFSAAAAAQIAARLLSPESYVGWSVKGASRTFIRRSRHRAGVSFIGSPCKTEVGTRAL